MLNVIDLFSGVGGLSYGFKKAGYNILLSNEIDPVIAAAYKRNHENVQMINEDITKIELTSFKHFIGMTDVIVGGPPCQGFSQKGRRALLEDDRNYLFKHFYKMVEYIRPKYFLMENVPNILTANNKHFFNLIYELFYDLGYQMDSKTLNASDYGVPQSRRRAFIIGKFEGFLGLPESNNSSVTALEAISDLAFLNSGEGQEIQEYRLKPVNEYQRLLRDDMSELRNHVATNHSSLAIERMKLIPKGKGREVLPKEHLTKSIYSGTWGRILEDKPSVTITTRFDTPSSGRFTHPYLNRAITVREAARLQSFPDSFIFYGPKTSQMKQVGNAVPPILAYEIAKAIRSDIMKKEIISV
ncbi:DNA cytosine methyltransferase [Alkalicoccobacillus gibsonii]|uniref:DNA cytosine methyltransferase n=1 Tax=Alkalicoccobacillus gibsonii TaxID=79881 RepID=UPI001932AF64|nr:DNA cytosine methyltransferase [Alkalicoccobacillus gibsonii]MBM0066768.1 DNA cytosine methyltransferase [Alkalicoccobacillus gibsonii]